MNTALITFLMTVESFMPSHKEVYGLPNKEAMCLTHKYAAYMVNDYIVNMQKDLKLPKGLTEGQRIALESFAYNVGTPTANKSTLFKLVREGKFAKAAKEFDNWVFIKGKKSKGLADRRAKEKALFMGDV